MEQSLPTFNSVIVAAQSNNNSSEIVICGRSGSDALCAPSRFFPKARLIRLNREGSKDVTKLVPNDVNKPELLRRKDIRGVATLAAYVPLQNFGIGITLKIDADSLIVPLREHVTQLLLFTLSIVGLGVIFAKLQIQPLLAQVVHEQTKNVFILANLNDAFVAMDADGNITDWNAKAENLFQLPAVDVIGQKLSSFLAPLSKHRETSDGSPQFNVLEQHSNLNHQVEVMARRRDGTLLPVELSVSGFHDGRSQVTNAFIRDISARKFAEQKLTESERFVREVTDNLPALVGYVDINERYQFANQCYQTMLGIDPKSIIGKTIADVLGETTYKAIESYIKQVKNGVPVRFERRGSEVGRPDYFSTAYIPDIDQDGAVVGFFIHIIDTSIQKQNELLLRQSEQRLKAITDNLPALITHVDMQERYTFVNGYVLPVFGIEPEKMVGRTIREMMGEAFYKSVAHNVQACLNGETVSFEGNITAIGKNLSYQANYVPELGTNGNVAGFYAITFDITDRKKEELLRRQSEERLRLITDNLPVLISYLDKDHRYQFGNATFLTWFDTDPTQIIGKHVADIIGESAYEQRRAYIDRGFAGETVEFDITTTALRIRRILHTVYVPHVSITGAVDGLCTISTDVTIQKDAEQELAALALLDPLTELPNRRQFNERIDEALARHQRTSLPLALMFIDVDKFKDINDSFGHAVGDIVLMHFANRLKNCMRMTDTVARYAGDEFVILIEGFKAPDELNPIAKKILTAIRKPMNVGSRILHVTTSIGITMIYESDRSAGPILARADEALYMAKRAGRDDFHTWTASSPK